VSACAPFRAQADTARRAGKTTTARQARPRARRMACRAPWRQPGGGGCPRSFPIV